MRPAFCTPRLHVLSHLFLSMLMVLPAVAQLQWENRGQPDFSGGGTGAAVTNDIVVTSGESCDPNQNCTWYVRAQDRFSGSTLWEDRLRDPVFFDLAKQVAIEGDRVFAAGWVYEPPVGYQFVSRAYDLHSGALLWDQRINYGFGGDTAKVVSVDGGRVFVGGYFSHQRNEFDSAVVAYDAASGTEFWRTQSDQTEDPHSAVWSISAAGPRVYAAGEYSAGGGVFVRAYDQATGTVPKEAKIATAQDFASPEALVASAGRVFVSGGLGGTQFGVAAYDARTGKALWQRLVHDPSHISQATAVTAAGGRVFVSGIAGCNPITGVECKLLLRAYDAVTGDLLWQATNQSEGNDWSVYSALAANEALVAVGGQSLDGAGHYEGEIRLYDTQSGRFLWRDRFDGGGTGAEEVGQLVLDGQQLFLTGQISRPQDENSDFLVRAYCAKCRGSK